MNLEIEIQRVSDSILGDILKILGLPPNAGWHKFCSHLFRKAIQHLAEIGLTFDQMIASDGFRKASEWSLNQWCRDIRVSGSDNVPHVGPLLIVSNHPGAYDALVISAQLPRPDLNIIASDLPFFRALHNLSQRIFFIPFNTDDAIGRMGGMLSAVRYLKDGGAVLLMGSGTIDPDPAVYPGALENLHRWTEAASLFLRFVPQTRIILTAVSHIVSPHWARHPLTWLRRGGMEKRWIAEFGQVIQQLFFPGSLYVSPRLSFSKIISAPELGNSPRDALVQREALLLTDHCRQFGGRIS
jgi:hypothetical protein